MSLDVRRHDAFHRREMSLVRVGWVALSLFLAAGLLGLLGPGPLSSRTAVGPRGLVEVEYQAMAHIEADDSLTLRFAPEAVEDGTIVVDLVGDWVHAVEWQGVTPQPAGESLVPNGLRLEFDAAGEGVTQVQIFFRPQALWRQSAVATVRGDAAAFHPFVLP